MCKRKIMTIAIAAGIVGMMTGCGIFDKGETATKKSDVAATKADDVTGGEMSSAETEDKTEEVTTGNDMETKNETGTEDTSVPAEKNEHETYENGDISFDERVNFENAAFLGDSRTAGLDEKLVVGQADFYASVGITIKDVMEKKLFTLSNGQKGTMLEAVSEKNYDRIYLMFGINELGWPYKESFEQYYTTIIEALKQNFPNAEIYVQSIIPMVAGRTDEIYNNEKISLFNTYIQEVVQNTGVNWVDVSVAVVDDTGALPEEASTDGIHLSRNYLFKWADYLKKMTY